MLMGKAATASWHLVFAVGARGRTLGQPGLGRTARPCV